jgi:hypothetical protein
MEKLLEIARAFYGVVIPKRIRRTFYRITVEFLDQRYSIETAIGLAIRKLNLD